MLNNYKREPFWVAVFIWFILLLAGYGLAKLIPDVINSLN